MRTTIVLAAALALAVGCSKKKSGGDVLAKLEGFSKSMCECKDKACADKVNDEMTKWGAEMAKTADKDAKPDPDMAKKSADVMTKYTECMTKMMMGGAGTGSAGSGSDAGSGAGTGSAGSAATGSGSDAGDKDQMAHNAGNCPSTVLGAETKAEVKGKDVVLTITATDKDAIASIQKRSAELLKEKADAPDPKGAHDQKGTQGGGKGICPVFWEAGGKAVAKNDAKGAIITITPKDKPEALKATIDDRIAKAKAWVKDHIKDGTDKNQGAVGGGSGNHGANHSGSGDGKGKERDKGGSGAGTGGGGGKGTGGGGGGGKGGGAKAGGW